MKKTIYSKNGKIIRQRLMEIRKKSGLTQRELGKRLNQAHSFISKCERGERRVDIAEFYLICKACGVSPYEEASTLIKAFDKK
ncbi:MAG: helix-turn-helix domain-containing protein [Desulfobacterales bacterium]|nr:helix-turn-helix domain-containing protein [Desulfobacterales bacterium]